MGLFSKREQEASQISQEPELPDVPPVEELDIPPPPQYPKQQVAPRPEIPMPIVHEPLIQQEQQITQKIEVPIEQLLAPKIQIPRPQELSRERILNAIGIEKEPIFVRVDDYREILEGMTRIRNNLKEATDLVLRLNELKNEEDKEFDKWRLELEDVQRKLMYVDKIIFES
jgi:hypothetical protein